MKNIINIVSAQTLPNYLFVREKYKKGDKIIWIVTHKVQKALSCLKSTLSDIDVANQKEILLEEDGEENISYMTNLLKEEISPNEQYCVNLTGGTKLMAITIYDFFKSNYPNTSFFYYIPWPKNIIQNIKTQEKRDITYRVTIKEYLSLYDIKISNGHEMYLSFENAKDMFNKMNNLRNIYSTELSELRKLKDKGKFKRDKNKSWSFTETGTYKLKVDSMSDETTRAKRIQDFIEKNDLPKKSDKGFICGNDMTYLTGEWLEELVYYITKEIERPDDIVCGIVVKKNEDNDGNELDVVYTKENKLYIRECKTGWEKGNMFNQIVYKAKAIKSLFGLSVKSSLYSYTEGLSTINDEERQKEKQKEENRNQETLKKMDIGFFGKNDIADVLNKLN